MLKFDRIAKKKKVFWSGVFNLLEVRTQSVITREVSLELAQVSGASFLSECRCISTTVAQRRADATVLMRPSVVCCV